MLRRSLLPSTSFGRFSSTACFALPLLQHNFSFASTKSKTVVMKTQKKRGSREKIDFDAIDIGQLAATSQNTFRDTFALVLVKENRARLAWKIAKKATRQWCSPNDPSFIFKSLAAFSVLPYASSTKMDDLSTIRMLYRNDFSFISEFQFRRVYTSLQSEVFKETPQKQEIACLSLSQMKKLLVNTKLLTPLDRAIFQCFVLGCKLGDLSRQQRVFLPKHHIVLIRQQRVNSVSSFIRYVPSTKEQFERVWKQSALKISKQSFSDNLVYHIRKKLKSSQYTTSSISEGTAKFLRDCGVPDKEITNVTGDAGVHVALNARSSPAPQKTAPRQQAKTITKLIKAIFPDGKY